MWKKIVPVANITKMLLKNCFIIIYLYIPNVIIVSYQQLGLFFWIKKQFDDFFFRYTNLIIILSLSFQIMILLPPPLLLKIKRLIRPRYLLWFAIFFFSFSYMKMNFFFVLIFFPFRNPQPIRLIFITYFFCIFQCQHKLIGKKTSNDYIILK